MTRAHLIRTSNLAEAAASNACLAATYEDRDPAKAREYARHCEAALYAALDALSQSGLADLSNQAIAARAARQEIAA